MTRKQNVNNELCSTNSMTKYVLACDVNTFYSL